MILQVPLESILTPKRWKHRKPWHLVSWHPRFTASKEGGNLTPKISEDYLGYQIFENYPLSETAKILPEENQWLDKNQNC